MGVDMNVVVFYGWKLSSTDKNWNEEIFELMNEIEISKNYKFDYVLDGMCGEYFYVGYEISNIDPYDNDYEEFNGNKFINNLSPQNLEEKKLSIKECLPFIDLDKDPSLYVFVHYT